MGESMDCVDNLNSSINSSNYLQNSIKQFNRKSDHNISINVMMTHLAPLLNVDKEKLAEYLKLICDYASTTSQNITTTGDEWPEDRKSNNCSSFRLNSRICKYLFC